jgi:hypothetical protein
VFEQGDKSKVAVDGIRIAVEGDGWHCGSGDFSRASKSVGAI